MKIQSIVIVGVVLLALGLGAWWTLGTRTSTELSSQASHEMSTKKVQYTCPMHPQIIRDHPGTCPICGMDLVPIDKGDTHSGHDPSDQDGVLTEPQKPEARADFSLSMDKQQMIGVKLGKAEKKTLFKSVRAPGRIAFDPELYTAQSEYLEALRQWNRIKSSPISDVRENTQQMIRSSKIRLKVLGLSDDQIASLAQKGSQSEGLLVSGKGQDSWIYADVFEVDLPYIKKDLSAKITANFLQGKTLAGKVISVDQVINPDTRTAKVRIQLLESDPSIRPESYVNVTIFAPVGEHTAVPLEALMDTGRDIYVFVAKGDGQFEPRKVTVLLETDRDAAIGSGLLPGETVVIGGNFMLDSESRLKGVLKGADQNTAHDH